MALAPIRKMNTASPGEFFGKLLQMRDLAHLTHLRQPDLKFSTHKALDKLYKDIVGIVDTLIESWQGVNGLVEITIPSSTFSEDPIALVQSMYSYVQSGRTQLQESWIQNQIDELCTLLAQTLYRLKYLS